MWVLVTVQVAAVVPFARHVFHTNLHGRHANSLWWHKPQMLLPLCE